MEEIGRRAFTIGECLGRGGFGEVYRARMASTGGLESEVAVKVLRMDLDPAGQAMQRLRDEGRLLARCKHPAILKVHDLVVLEGRVALVTEFVDGEDLTGCFRGDDPIPRRALIEVIAQVAGALATAWSERGPDGRPMELVHRDIKPSNIRIGRHGQVKVLDFGIARSDAMTREARTQTDMVVGSPQYMAPERFLGTTVHPASDVFALGCTLYEGLAGRRLYRESNILFLSSNALDEHRHAAYVESCLAALPSDVDPELRALLERLLLHDPEARPSAGELIDACERLAERSPGRTLARWCRDRAWASGEVAAGPLAGRSVTEGSLATRAEPLSQELATDRVAGPGTETLALPTGGGPRWGIALAAIGATVSLALVLVVGALAAGGVAWSLSGPSVVAPAEDAVAPTTEDGAPSAGEGEAGPPAREAPESDPPPPAVAPPAVSAPVAAPEPRPREVAPAETPPAPAKVAKAPAAPTTGHVSVVGEVAVALIGEGARLAAPADVPPGPWRVEVTFPGRPAIAAGTLTVVAGGDHAVECNPRMFRCELR